jgi:cytochrome c oxidase subunit IV
MSLQEAAAAGAAAHSHEETVTGTGHAHPSDRSYVGIALILALITAAEVGTFYLEEELGSILIPALLVMMVVKFAMVAGWFMHLRFDSTLFTRMFVSGVVLAVFVYLAMLATFQFFSEQGEPTPVVRYEEQPQ